MNPLSDFDFSVIDDKEYGEDSVREDIVTPLLKALGYSAGGPSKMVRSRRLLHPYVYLGSIKQPISIIPDYILEPEGARAWILDAKAPRENIIAGRNPEQAFSYAIHPTVRAKYYALCNGHQFALFHVSGMGPQLVISLDGDARTFDTLQKALAPLHHKDAEEAAFSPDLGISLLKLGYERGTRLAFYPMGVPTIAFLGKNRYTAVVTIRWGDEWLAASFDFGQKVYRELLGAVTVDEAARIRTAMSHAPFKIHFGWDAPIVNIDAKLGKQIMYNSKEDYLPFDVKSFKKASLPSTAADF